MKTKLFFYLALLLVGFFFFSGNVYSQETKESKKALDAFINATTKSAVASEPVPGAEITVEQQPGPIIIKKCVTDKNGEFTVLIEEIELAFEKIERKGSNKILIPNEINLQFTIKPKDPSRFPVENNSVVIKVKKSDGPKFTFVVTYQKPTIKTNKGTFAVNSKAQSGW